MYIQARAVSNTASTPSATTSNEHLSVWNREVSPTGVVDITSSGESTLFQTTGVWQERFWTGAMTVVTLHCYTYYLFTYYPITYYLLLSHIYFDILLP